MAGIHLWAMLITLALYAALGTAFWGWGEIVAIGAGLGKPATGRWPMTFSIWLGWASVLYMFHLLHFVFPLNFYSVTPVLALGLVAVPVLLNRERIRFRIALSRSSWAVIVVVVLAMLLLSGWIASRAMLSPTNYDSGLYHFQAIRWMNSFPIVPGLGNLHGRLAFNQSFLTYAAALNFHPLFGHGRSIANSFLLVLAVLTSVELLWPFVRQPAMVVRLNPLHWAPALWSLPILAYWVLSVDGWASPSPDTTSKLLQIIVFVMFASMIGGLLKDGVFLTRDAMVLTALAATTVTIKLSNLAFSAVIMGLILLAILKILQGRVRVVIPVIMPALLIVLVWCLRGYILSGAPLYPSAFGYVRTEWAVPVERIIEEANWVYSWARQPHTHWSKVLESWNWFDLWWQRQANDLTNFVFPLTAFSLTMMASVALFLLLRPARLGKLLLGWAIIILPIVIGLIFWFLTAPDPRFANALFMLLPVAANVLLLSLVQNRISHRAFIAIICAAFVVSNLHLLQFAYLNRWTLRDVSTSGFQAIRQVALEEKITECGLHLFVPATGDQCWDAPFPCTPYFNKALCLREPSEMASGFSIRDIGSSVPQIQPSIVVGQTQ